MDLQNGPERIIAFILDEKGENIAGIGFLASANLLLTCAHIIQQAGSGPGKTVAIKFLNADSIYRAFVTAWRPPAELDLAILRIDKVPDSVRPLPLSRPSLGVNVDIIASYPKSINDFGSIFVRSGSVLGEYGELLPGYNQRYLQLNLVGASGSPVYDPKNQVVIGMVMGKISDDSVTENSYAISMASTARLYSNLIKLSKALEVEEEDAGETLARQLMSYRLYREIASWLEKKEIPFKLPRKHSFSKERQRVLNLNFAAVDDEHILALNEFLLAGQKYDLLVDIGPLWDKIPSLLRGNAAFPEDAEVPYLSAADREKGWFDIEAVFVSQDFQPSLVSARMRVPAKSMERSTPYIDGKLGEKPGPVRLAVQAPEIAPSKKMLHAHGRLCLYYGAQVLQSAVVNVKVTRWPEWSIKPGNFAIVDYVLTPGFENVGTGISLRRHTNKEGQTFETPIKIGLMVNDDLSGTHRILVKLHDEKKGKPSLPPAWKAYDAKAISKTLKEARRILVNPADKELEAYIESDTFILDKFKDDLMALAKLGAELYSVLLQGVTPAENIPPLVWRKKFRNALQPGDVIQLARAGSVPSTHIIPWALVYDYPLELDRSDLPLKLCRVVEEQWDSDSTKRRKPFSEQEIFTCPYEHEHGTNVICPFGFWGYKYTLEQPISALLGKGWDVEPARRVLAGTPIKMAVAATVDVPHESRRQQHFQLIHDSVNAEYIPAIPATERDQVRDSLRAPQLVYILCHGGKDGKITYLSIGPRDKDARHTITPELPGSWGEHDYIDLEKWAKTRPLVFINGCSTTDLLPELTLDFVSAFRDLLAGGVIGTEIQVTVEHGYLAAEKFFERLGHGEDVGQAILGMRWDLLNQGSFLGLAYTPYAMADLHLERGH